MNAIGYINDLLRYAQLWRLISYSLRTSSVKGANWTDRSFISCMEQAKSTGYVRGRKYNSHQSHSGDIRGIVSLQPILNSIASLSTDNRGHRSRKNCTIL